MPTRNTTVSIAAGEKREAGTKVHQSQRSTDSDNLLNSEFYFEPILSHSIRAFILACSTGKPAAID